MRLCVSLSSFRRWSAFASGRSHRPYNIGNPFEIVRYRVGPALGTAPDSDGSSDARRTSAARRHLLLLIRRGRSEWSGCPRGKSVSAARGEPAPCAAGRNRSAGNRAAHRAIRDGPHHRATFIIANSNQKSLIRSMVAAQGEAVGQSDCSTIFCG
jgi:hypothetical protein